ncbi:hypothetical protein [Sphingomonas baiyangensis]|uniref:Uncharacterized protein n=1 Tax=Sphingomonas baiyangensis TaxID=2572576 RepID=A0A4U1L2M7_9SPHN|nr:hypothetical protein [Sphingomonas baiyangensis]TKD51109.1 hypothetical protein FBR43_10320 [Sphingomonas baiyangensis]
MSLSPKSRSPIARSSLARSPRGRSPLANPIVLLVLVLVLLVGGLFFLAGRDATQPQTTVEKAVALENLAN